MNIVQIPTTVIIILQKFATKKTISKISEK